MELRLKIEGTLRNQPFKLHTGLHFINGIPNPIELGITKPEEKPLTLYLTSHVILHGDVRKSDLILDETGRSIKNEKAGNAHHQLYKEGLTDAKTGFLLKAYRLHPSFLTFSSTNSEGQADPDPFGGGTEISSKEADYKYLKNRDARIPASPTDRVIDIKDLLAKNGVGFKPGEFAALNLETDSLFVFAKPITNELIQGIVTPAGSWGNLRSIATQIKLSESSVKPTPQSLGKEDQTTLFQAAIETLPGQSSSLILGPLHLDLEPQIIQSTIAEGKWQSLVITTTIQSPCKELPSKGSHQPTLNPQRLLNPLRTHLPDMRNPRRKKLQAPLFQEPADVP